MGFLGKVKQKQGEVMEKAIGDVGKNVVQLLKDIDADNIKLIAVNSAAIKMLYVAFPEKKAEFDKVLKEYSVNLDRE